MSSYRHNNKGNTALESTTWTLTRDEAKALRSWIKEENPDALNVGTYWHSTFVKPYNRMIRNRSETLEVLTAGFSTGEFSNWLHACNFITVESNGQEIVEIEVVNGEPKYTSGENDKQQFASTVGTSLTNRFASARQRAASDKRTPTDEQTAIIKHASGMKENDVLVIEAGAGAGKTSTLRMLVDVMKGNGQYTAFNKSLVTDSKAKFTGTRCECNTTHSLAFRAEGKRFEHRLNGNRVRSEQVATMLGIEAQMIMVGGSPKTLNAGFLAALVKGAIRRYCQSGDETITASHFKYLDGIDVPAADGRRTYANNERVREYLLPFALKAWEDYRNPEGTLSGFEHDFYVKIWERNNPIIAADYILLDEDQDSAAVLLSIVQMQVARGTPVILVGDENQAIYEWRGCVNAAAAFPDAPRKYLTMSFRFGQVIADLANKVLAELSEPTQLRIKGLPTINSRLVKEDEIASEQNPNGWEPTCVLCRTNAAAVATLLGSIAEGKRPFLVGGGADVLAFIEAAKDLQEGRPTGHPDLACFNSWMEVEEYAKTDEGEDLKLMVKLIKEFDAQKIIDALKHMPEERDADLCISTAHKSKGREWDKVQLAGDFPTRDKSDDSDLRLLYVAVTRAKLELDVTRCPFFIGKEGMDVEDLIANQPLREPESLLPPAPSERVQTGPYTWAKRDGKWMIRGPKITLPATVTVQRANGSSSEVTLRKVVAEYPEATIYEHGR